MKLNKLLSIILCLFGLNVITNGQDFTTYKGAKTLSLMGSMANLGGELFNEENNRKTLSFGVTMNRFLSNGFFIGGGIDVSNVTQQEKTSNSLEIGPQIGFANRSPGSPAIPYIALGLKYVSMSTNTYSVNNNSTGSGKDVQIGVGLIMPIKNHIGLALEGGYHLIDLKEDDYRKSSTSGKIFYINMGIVGLLFKDSSN